MEPLRSLEGYNIIEDTDRSRALLNKFYQEEGYTLASTQQSGKDTHVKHSDEQKTVKSVR
jgi:hypothetical protein